MLGCVHQLATDVTAPWSGAVPEMHSGLSQLSLLEQLPAVAINKVDGRGEKNRESPLKDTKRLRRAEENCTGR